MCFSRAVTHGLCFIVKKSFSFFLAEHGQLNHDSMRMFSVEITGYNSVVTSFL